MTVRVYSTKKKKADKLLGEAIYALEMIRQGKIKKLPVEVYHKGKKAATMQVEFDYQLDNSSSQPIHQQAVVAPQTNWWQGNNRGQVNYGMQPIGGT